MRYPTPRSLFTLLPSLALLAAPLTGRGQTPHAEPDDRLRPLSLQQALQAALDGNPDLAVARARSDIAASQSRGAAAPLWPQLGLDAGYTRSTDPVFAFGAKLRQAAFAQQDFQVDALNDPDPIGDFSATLAARWGILDPKLWAARAAAKSQAEAASWSSERTREATLLLTHTLYYQAMSSQGQLDAARAALDAATSTVESFSSRQERGLLTRADLLGAQAEQAAARARLSAAQAARLDALEDLGRHLGWDADSLPLPTDTLSAPESLDEPDFDPRRRADLRALAAAEDAAHAARRQATFSFVPSVDGFGQYATHSADVFGFDENDWTVGVMLRWPLFAGFARFANVQRAQAESHIARIRYQEASRDARIELEQAQRAVRSARQQVDATQAAREAASSGRDLMRRRFDEGLATATDLLQAEARATAMRQSAIAALANYHIAVARLEFVRSQSNRGN